MLVVQQDVIPQGDTDMGSIGACHRQPLSLVAAWGVW